MKKHELEYLQELSRLALLEAAVELNEQFGLEPNIDTSEIVTLGELIEGMKKASELFDPETDILSELTLGVIDFTLKYKEA
jgi:hypothetical protein